MQHIGVQKDNPVQYCGRKN